MKIKIPKRRYNAYVNCNAPSNPIEQESQAHILSKKPKIVISKVFGAEHVKQDNSLSTKEVQTQKFNYGHANGQNSQLQVQREERVRELNYGMHDSVSKSAFVPSKNYSSEKVPLEREKRIKKLFAKSIFRGINHEPKGKEFLFPKKSTNSVEAKVLPLIPQISDKKFEVDHKNIGPEVIRPAVLKITNQKTIIDLRNGPRCNCKKSFCLRLHCACFSQLATCGPFCSCVNCGNKDENDKARQEVISRTREINPMAFKPKIKSVKEKAFNSRGCKCTKNSCIKKYCECYKFNISCSELCKCVDCKNNKIKGGKEFEELHEKGYRKKHRIVMVNKDDSSCGLDVQFVKHKKKRN